MNNKITINVDNVFSNQKAKLNKLPTRKQKEFIANNFAKLLSEVKEA